MLPGGKQFMEHTGLEPVTPTLPVLCAPNCANAPKTYRNIVKRKMPDCQEFFLLTSGISQNGGNIEKKAHKQVFPALHYASTAIRVFCVP